MYQSPTNGNFKKSEDFNMTAQNVRNPLTNINLAVDLLKFKIHDPLLLRYLEIITRSSDDINTFINDCLSSNSTVKAKLGDHRVN